MATAPFTTEKPLHGAEPPDCFESQIGRGRSTFYPDLAYIRRCVPIDDVAKRLGLQVSGKMVRCWRPDNHEHGDRTPSVGLNSRRNIAKCFVCDGRALSPIDLVMSVREEDLAAAVRWIVARFEVPAAPKGRHIQPPKRWLERFRIGTNGGSLETLIRSGIWASLTPAQRSLIPVLQTFMESGTSKVKISYRGMMRYAGVRSHSTISSSLIMLGLCWRSYAMSYPQDAAGLLLSSLPR